MSPLKLPTRFTRASLLSTLHNLGGAFGIQLALLVSGSLIARLLGPVGRGYFALLTVIPSSIGQLGTVGMSLAATYYLSSQAIGGTELIRLLRLPALLQLVFVAFTHALVIFTYIAVSGAPIRLAAGISLVTTPASLCLDYGLAFLLGARRHGEVNILRTLNPVLTATGIIGLYALHDHSVAAVVAVSMAASIIVGVLGLQRGISAATSITVLNSLVVRLGYTRARQVILGFGRRGYIGYLSPVETFRLDQLAVGFLLSPRELGFYVVAAAFTNLGRLVATNIGLSSTPDIAAQSDVGAQRQIVRHTLLVTGAILIALTSALALFVIVAIPLFFGKEYRSSIPIAEILLLASFLLAMKRVVVDTMRGMGDTRIGARAELLNLVLFLAGVVPLAFWLGGRGVALALVLAASGGSSLLISSLLGAGIFGQHRTRARRSR